MNRRALINELVDNGYEAGVLDSLNHSELTLLAQEEFIANHWTDASRAAALAKRELRGFATRATDRPGKAKVQQVTETLGGMRGLGTTHHIRSIDKLRQARKRVAREIKELRKEGYMSGRSLRD